MTNSGAVAFRTNRLVDRDEVHYRTKGIAASVTPLELVIVNISAMGLMARCEAPLQPDDRICIHLPVVGATSAQVRWSLGGRIGCELDRPIDILDYPQLLVALRRQPERSNATPASRSNR